jgi:hypothetical protein
MRPDNTAPIIARRRELTRARTIQALRELDRAGTPVTFAAVPGRPGSPAPGYMPQTTSASRSSGSGMPPGTLRPAHPGQPARLSQLAAAPPGSGTPADPGTARRTRPAPPSARPRARRPAAARRPDITLR